MHKNTCKKKKILIKIFRTPPTPHPPPPLGVDPDVVGVVEDVLDTIPDPYSDPEKFEKNLKKSLKSSKKN